MLTYPPGATDGVTIFQSDIARLEPGEFLNDTIIEFYFKYLTNTVMTDQQRDAIHIFSPFFYNRLSQVKRCVSVRIGIPLAALHGVAHARTHARTQPLTTYLRGRALVSRPLLAGRFYCVALRRCLVPHTRTRVRTHISSSHMSRGTRSSPRLTIVCWRCRIVPHELHEMHASMHAHTQSHHTRIRAHTYAQTRVRTHSHAHFHTPVAARRRATNG